MARIVYGETSSFKNIVEALSKIVDECLIRFYEDGMRLKALDPAHVSLISIFIPSSAFDEYQVEGEARFGFITSNLLKLVKRARKGDLLTFEVEEDRVTLEFKGPVTRRYRIVNLDVAEVEIPESSLEFNVSASILSDPLKNAIRDAEVVGDTLEVKAENEEELLLRGVGGGSEAETRITGESGALISLSVKEPSRSLYAIEHLKAILSITKVADTVELQFSSNMPLRLEFSLPREGRVEFLLAPKLE